MQPRARLLVQGLAAGVDEPDVHDPATGAPARRGSRSGRRARPAAAGAPSRAGRTRTHVMRGTGTASVEAFGERRARTAVEHRLDLGERAAAVVPEEAAAEPTGVGHDPELLAGVEVVRMAVDPQQLIAPDTGAGPASRPPWRNGAQVHAAEVGEPEPPARTTGHGSSTSPFGQRNGVAGSVGIAEQRAARREHARRVGEPGVAEHVDRPARIGHERERRRAEPDHRRARELLEQAPCPGSRRRGTTRASAR